MTALGLGPEDMLVAGSRALAVASLFLAFGTLLMRGCIAAANPLAERRLRRLQWGALAAAGASAVPWCGMEAAAMAGTASPGATLAVLPTVLAGTTFGRVQLIRLALLALTALVLAAPGRRAACAAAALAGLAVLLQAAMLHGYAMQQGLSLLLVIEALHVLAAASWLGALPALAILVAQSPPRDAALAAGRFSVIGIAAVAALAVSAAVQSWQLVGSWEGLFGSPYGRIALGKLLLFALLVAFAARNRLRLVPQAGAGNAAAQARLRHSIAFAAVLGFVVIALAALLGTMAPAIDLGGAG